MRIAVIGIRWFVGVVMVLAALMAIATALTGSSFSSPVVDVVLGILQIVFGVAVTPWADRFLGPGGAAHGAAAPRGKTPWAPIIIGVIVVGVLAVFAITAVGDGLNDVFNEVASDLSGAN